MTNLLSRFIPFAAAIIGFQFLAIAPANAVDLEINYVDRTDVAERNEGPESARFWH